MDLLQDDACLLILRADVLDDLAKAQFLERIFGLNMKGECITRRM